MSAREAPPRTNNGHRQCDDNERDDHEQRRDELAGHGGRRHVSVAHRENGDNGPPAGGRDAGEVLVLTALRKVGDAGEDDDLGQGGAQNGRWGTVATNKALGYLGRRRRGNGESSAACKEREGCIQSAMLAPMGQLACPHDYILAREGCTLFDARYRYVWRYVSHSCSQCGEHYFLSVPIPA